jgi:hypothetical protein
MIIRCPVCGDFLPPKKGEQCCCGMHKYDFEEYIEKFYNALFDEKYIRMKNV